MGNTVELAETFLHINVSGVRSENAYKIYVGCYGNKLLRQLKKGGGAEEVKGKIKEKIIEWKVSTSHHKLKVNLYILLEGI